MIMNWGYINRAEIKWFDLILIRHLHLHRQLMGSKTEEQRGLIIDLLQFNVWLQPKKEYNLRAQTLYWCSFMKIFLMVPLF